MGSQVDIAGLATVAAPPLAGRVTVPAGTTWTGRSGEACLLLVSLTGGVTVSSASGDIEVAASYGAVIPQGVEFRCEVGEDASDVFLLSFEERDLSRCSGSARDPYRLETSYSYYVIARLVSAALQQKTDAPPGGADGLFHRIARAEQKDQHGWARPVVEAVSASVHAAPTLDELSDVAGMHPMTLARKFRQHHDCSIGEFRQRMRAERAFYRVIKQHTPLSALSLECGYADQSHMTREFRRFFSLTPALLRKKREAR